MENHTVCSSRHCGVHDKIFYSLVGVRFAFRMVFSALGHVSETTSVESLVYEYFRRGYSYKDIVKVLHNVHGKDSSIRSLHRTLRRKGLYRKGNKTDSNLVIEFVNQEIKESGSLLGYRQIHQRCIQAGLNASRTNVSSIISAIDPDGVERGETGYIEEAIIHLGQNGLGT